MNNVNDAFAKINQACADMEADAKIIDVLAARILASAKAMREQSPCLSLAMGWIR
jgi:hypothetical protein